MMTEIPLIPLKIAVSIYSVSKDESLLSAELVLVLYMQEICLNIVCLQTKTSHIPEHICKHIIRGSSRTCTPKL